jgi:predicted TIM-barrel fold metal-dependent hydrolase
MSVTSPGVCFPDNRDFSIDIARWCNEYMAEVKKKHPGKFGGFASIPLNWIDESIEELKYALGTLGLDGVCLMTNYDGKYLGDEAFDDFFSELNKRKAVLYIHPSDPAEEYDPKLADTGIPNSLIEVTFETTRMAANLLYMDVTDRYPDIKYILSHGGGTIPYLGWRLAMIKYARKNKKPPVLRTLYDFLIKGGPEAGLNDLKQMYYDTALTSGPYALNTLNEFAGSSQIVFGSDFPMAKVAPIVVKNLDNHPEFSAKDIEDINYKNSLELFPQFQI